MDKALLKQYSSLIQEREELREKIDKVNEKIYTLESETVKDTVTGGEGGIQHFKIEGFASRDYAKAKNTLMNYRHKLSALDLVIGEQINELQDFINSIDDSYIRRIIDYRYMQNKSWQEVADNIGGGNTEDSVRMMLNRYLQR